MATIQFSRESIVDRQLKLLQDQLKLRGEAEIKEAQARASEDVARVLSDSMGRDAGEQEVANAREAEAKAKQAAEQGKGEDPLTILKKTVLPQKPDGNPDQSSSGPLNVGGRGVQQGATRSPGGGLASAGGGAGGSPTSSPSQGLSAPPFNVGVTQEEETSIGRAPGGLVTGPQTTTRNRLNITPNNLTPGDLLRGRLQEQQNQFVRAHQKVMEGLRSQEVTAAVQRNIMGQFGSEATGALMAQYAKDPDFSSSESQALFAKFPSLTDAKLAVQSLRVNYWMNNLLRQGVDVNVDNFSVSASIGEQGGVYTDISGQRITPNGQALPGGGGPGGGTLPGKLSGLGNLSPGTINTLGSLGALTPEQMESQRRASLQNRQDATPHLTALAKPEGGGTGEVSRAKKQVAADQLLTVWGANNQYPAFNVTDTSLFFGEPTDISASPVSLDEAVVKFAYATGAVDPPRGGGTEEQQLARLQNFEARQQMAIAELQSFKWGVLGPNGILIPNNNPKSVFYPVSQRIFKSLRTSGAFQMGDKEIERLRREDPDRLDQILSGRTGAGRPEAIPGVYKQQLEMRRIEQELTRVDAGLRVISNHYNFGSPGRYRTGGSRTVPPASPPKDLTPAQRSAWITATNLINKRAKLLDRGEEIRSSFDARPKDEEVNSHLRNLVGADAVPVEEVVPTAPVRKPTGIIEPIPPARNLDPQRLGRRGVGQRRTTGQVTEPLPKRRTGPSTPRPVSPNPGRTYGERLFLSSTTNFRNILERIGILTPEQLDDVINRDDPDARKKKAEIQKAIDEARGQAGGR